jgi:endonuclease YncB( thermonuclease family)
MRIGYLSLFLIISPLARPAWRTLDGVSFVENTSNDGDSFHAKRNSREYIFRLYFVDTPETDDRYPDRVKEQADYFGVTPEQVIAGGKEATKITQKFLEKADITVRTQYENARGASDIKRYYAMVQVGDRELCELLVEQGYARVYGVGRELPDGTAEKSMWSRLRKLEKEAKEAKRGLWGVAAGTVVLDGQEGGVELKLPAITPIFSKEPPHRMVGQLPKGWPVSVGLQTRTGFREVRFTSPGGNEFIGEIQEVKLP